MSAMVRLGKARREHNESGVPQKAEVVGMSSHFINNAAGEASFRYLPFVTLAPDS